ncbi:GNAT family N-acetyltransferase [Stutzerimonas stutzeri]|uniref:GNAT family N-acetyltransferase n=1 Tax=Stutzerimonas stutzeri TaxID=316 RepID=UPI00210AE8B6|nr:GNAT family N-acetyltransferase [Stutzerimonas stutzeri]MCQ4260193.1 GNAT family N-acetyltransferase [Stutzerimonas stutzeri]
MSNFEITTLTPDRWQLYKSIRLQALKDAPDSYGSTLEQEAAMSDTEWKSRLDLEVRDIKALPLVATTNGEAVGLAWGLVDAQASSTAHVYQMWVSPTVRGKGVGKLLLKEITSWAVGRRCTHMRLAVTTTNDAAFRLYSAYGFTAVGQQEELRSGSALMVQPMMLNLNPGA